MSFGELGEGGGINSELSGELGTRKAFFDDKKPELGLKPRQKSNRLSRGETCQE